MGNNGVPTWMNVCGLVGFILLCFALKPGGILIGAVLVVILVLPVWAVCRIFFGELPKR